MLANLLAHHFVLRWDMTDDQRYTLRPCTQQLVAETAPKNGDAAIVITNYLTGDLNSGFRRLEQATEQLADELGIYGKVRYRTLPYEGERLQPTVIHERTQNGKTAQTTVYPYAEVQMRGRSALVSLLKNQRGLSGEENLNQSIENLEYALAEAIQTLAQNETPRIAFLEGHGELDERNVYDVSMALSQYFQIDRGIIGDDPHILDPYKVVIIADPQTPFSDTDKYVLDAYLGQGGTILWLLNGVRLSQDYLTEEGFTPVIALDLNLQDMLFQYGIRIEPVLVQDAQCLPIPVNVAGDGQEPNYQPMPWYYAPLLLTSQVSPITRNLGQVSSTFASAIDAVGEDSIRKEILLATSSASRLIGVPAEVDLGDLNPDLTLFKYQHVPVAVALEGVFRYRTPQTPLGNRQQRKRTKQIVVASGSVIRNEIQKNQALPAGYDRYSGMQFANRDFITNAVLYLADNEGLIELRQKTVELRLLNDKRAHENRRMVQLVSTIVPIAVLALIGGTVTQVRRRKYRKI